MKCRIVLPAAVSAALMLSASLSALAQTNPFLTLKSDAAANLKVGDTFDIVTMVSSPVNATVSTVQATLIYDPNVLSFVGVTNDSAVLTPMVTKTVTFGNNGSSYTGYQYAGSSFTPVTAHETEFATFQFKVTSALTKPTTVGYSSYLLDFSSNATNEAVYGSFAVVDGSDVSTLFNDGKYSGKWTSNPAAAPEVSTYLMFAMSGLPILVFMRRRRSRLSD